MPPPVQNTALNKSSQKVHFDIENLRRKKVRDGRRDRSSLNLFIILLVMDGFSQTCDMEKMIKTRSD